MFFVTPLKNLYMGVKSIRIILILIALLLLSNCSTHTGDATADAQVNVLIFFGLLPFLFIWMIFNWDTVQDFAESPIGKIFGFIIGVIFIIIFVNLF